MQGHTAFAVPFSTGYFGAIKPPGNHDLNALGTQPYGITHGTFHRTAESHTADQLVSNTLCNELGIDFRLGVLAIPFTLFWLLGAVNALNFIDGVDGLATSVGIVLSVAIALLAIFTQNQTEAFMALAMAAVRGGVGFLARLVALLRLLALLPKRLLGD